MAHFEISTPQSNLVRIAFKDGWDAAADSAEMFKNLVATLDNCEDDVTLMIVAGNFRPSYKNDARGPAHDVLYHERIRRIIVVAAGASYAVTHMGATRGQRGLTPIPMLAFESEDEARAHL